MHSDTIVILNLFHHLLSLASVYDSSPNYLCNLYTYKDYIRKSKLNCFLVYNYNIDKINGD